ncbi:hypothetical protein DXT63_13060 [Thermoanaerobacteraceae bacterium SP2]|nr:hypothetical protein DXT63_13060 [Thermoanaerobacteraceae bacterium SP2]
MALQKNDRKLRRLKSRFSLHLSSKMILFFKKAIEVFSYNFLYQFGQNVNYRPNLKIKGEL